MTRPGDNESAPSTEEQEAVRKSLAEMEAGAVDSPEASTLFEEEFAAKHGIRFRADPPDSLQFEYDSDGTVIVRNMQPGSGDEGGNASLPPEVPIDEKQENENPFAIKVEVASTGLNGDWASANVIALSGTYQTQGGAAFDANGVAFPAAALTETVTKGVNGQFRGYIYLYIPLVLDNTSGIPVSNSPNRFKAAAGGQIRTRSSPATVWPQIIKVVGGVATTLLIGSWNIQRVNISAGVPTYELRIEIDQKVTDHIVLGDPSDDDETVTPMPFGEATNDMLYWNHTEKAWKTLPAPATSGTFIPGVKDGVFQWLSTEECDDA